MTPKELRDCLVAVIGDDLGQYARPMLPNIPAFWVWDRPLPADFKVVTAPLNQPSIPALEGVLDPNPTVKKRSRNTRSLTVDWVWTFRLIAHDRRQSFSPVIDRMLCHFRQIDDPIYIEGSDLYNPQFQFSIPFLATVEVN
jgi:hypothetical protein